MLATDTMLTDVEEANEASEVTHCLTKPDYNTFGVNAMFMTSE